MKQLNHLTWQVQDRDIYAGLCVAFANVGEGARLQNYGKITILIFPDGVSTANTVLHMYLYLVPGKLNDSVVPKILFLLY